MSQTKFVEYSDNGFWAYDVALHVFLKHLIDAAQASSHANTPWVLKAITDWRSSCIPDVGLTLYARNRVEQEVLVALVEDACVTLAKRTAIPTSEIVSWAILDEVRIFPRGANEVLTGPIVELGRAVIALSLGELPEPPPGAAWFYGSPDGRKTIGMISDWRSRL